MWYRSLEHIICTPNSSIRESSPVLYLKQINEALYGVIASWANCVRRKAHHFFLFSESSK